MKPTVELIGDDGRIIWLQPNHDRVFTLPPGNWRLRSAEPFPPDGYRAVGHGSDTTVTVPIDIAQRMLDWQAAIRQSNGGKDTPLSDACGEAAKEIERLRAAGQGEITARAGYEHIKEALKWRQIETAPKVDGDDLLLWEDGLAIGWWSDFFRGWQVNGGDGPRQADPTHWMPKPAPPKGEA